MRTLSERVQTELTGCGIEIATKNDLEDILKLQKLAYQENAIRYNDFSILPLTQTLEELKKESESSIILKVVEGGMIVGSVRAFEKDGSCYIGRLIVHPGYQNKGIGKKLMKAIEKCFEGVRLELFTGYLDEKNLAFYDLSFDKKYDAVVSSLALHHLVTKQDKLEFYHKIYSCLNAGGVFINADVVLAATDALQKRYMEQWKSFMCKNVSMDEVDNKWIPTYYEEDRPVSMMEHFEMLKDAGFEAKDVIWKYYNFAVYMAVK